MEGASPKETMEFGAEVNQLLDIVVNSLYTDREIFVRELISNAADALEKLRYLKLIHNDLFDEDLPLEIRIELDGDKRTFTIYDTGVGMTRDELVENFGTIAHSGSKAFIKNLAQGNLRDANLIGQFGVGFYSAFMVAERVEVHTRSYIKEEQGWKWTSHGSGSYSIEKVDGLTRGTRVVLYLKEDAGDFTKPDNIKGIIKKYSGFVPFPILVNGERVNTVQALWTKNKSEVREEEYTEFYRYIANAYDEPLFTFHFSADAPIAINAILFVPGENFERFGLGKLEPGVNLYCRRILIQQKSDILPPWLRFVRGVVDSEELPLNISRESMQGNALVGRLRRVITGRFLKFLNQQAKNKDGRYKEFWEKFGMFIREGAAADTDFRDELVELMRFESSKLEPGRLVSLEEYVERMKEGQEAIYYLNAPSREMAEAGPYMEAFRQRDLEVIFTRDAVDDYILSLLGEYKGKKLVSADQDNLKLIDTSKEEAAGEDALPEQEAGDLIKWLKKVLGDRISEVRESERLVESPAVVLNPEGFTGGMQRVMQAVNKEMGGIGPKVLEINTRHRLVKALNFLRKNDEQFARVAAEQILDNALISAGLMVEFGTMVDRVYRILERALEQQG